MFWKCQNPSYNSSTFLAKCQNSIFSAVEKSADIWKKFLNDIFQFRSRQSHQCKKVTLYLEKWLQNKAAKFWLFLVAILAIFGISATELCWDPKNTNLGPSWIGEMSEIPQIPHFQNCSIIFVNKLAGLTVNT